MIKNLSALSITQHVLIGVIGAFWLTLFLVLVGPFDAASLPLSWRIQVMYRYGLIFLGGYLVAAPFHRWLYRRTALHKGIKESLFFLLVFLLCWWLCYGYYQSEIIRGDYSFYRFSLEIFLPTLVLLFPVLFLTRVLVQKSRITFLKKSAKGEVADWKSKIDRLIEEKIYLDQELNLQKMANELETNSSILSKAINDGYGKNFNDFINAHRVAAVQQSLKNGAHKEHTLAGVANDCGFKSKATFYRAFKKHTDMSPSEYLKCL